MDGRQLTNDGLNGEPHGMTWSQELRVGLLVAATLLLTFAVAVQFRPGGDESAGPVVDLHALFATEPAGWTWRDLPIGDTEQVRQTAEKTLRYDDYFYRAYRRGTVEFSVYVAYWRPGKQPPQMITQHVPDRCWTLAGMTCEEMRFDVPLTVGSTQLWPAQWRKFRTPGGRVVYTLFWHLVGDRAYDFGQRFYDMPGPVVFWKEAFAFHFGRPREQWFFRLTSSVPPEAVLKEAAAQEVLLRVADIRRLAERQRESISGRSHSQEAQNHES